MKKRCFAVLLAIAMIFSILPMTAMAADSSSVADEAELTAAVAEAAAGDVIQLTDNITLSATLSVPAEQSITLDLNGHTLSVAADVDVIDNSGTLTVKNGTVAAKENTAAHFAVNNQKSGVLTVEQDEGQETKLIGRCGIQNYGTVVINDGTVTSYNRNAIYTEAGSSTTINGGQILASGGSSGMGRAVSALGDVTITGGYFYAGGSSGAGDNYMNAISMFYDGVLTIRPAEGKTVTVISETDYAVSTMYNAKVYIYGGSFACNGSRTDVLDFESAGNVQIYGGTFKHEPYADYLPEGYIAVEEDSGYVVQAAQPAADLTVNSYEELAGALNGSVLEPKHITLGADMTIPAGADLTLQQGYTLTVPGDVTLTVDGILSLDSTMTNDGTLTVGAQGFVEHPLNLTNNGTITDYPTVENGVCTISTPMQLQWLSCLVEWDNGNIPASVRLAGDIAMPDVEFTPIGSSSFYYGSTFDGGNHTISDLQVVVTSEYRGGLFGNVGDVTVKNLTISGTSTNSTSSYIGALAGYMSGSCTVQNVHIQDYTVSSPISYGVGGFVGQIWTDDPSARVEFIGCTLDADVTGYANQGAVWGTSTGSKGTIGIYNCTLAGTVTTINVNGGICGGYGATAPVEIIGLDHSGLTVTVKGTETDKLVAYTSATNNLQPDKEAVKTDGVWTAADAGTIAATVDGMPYASFADAVAAAGDGSLVSVERNVVLTEAVAISADVKVTGFAKISVGAGGSLTISAGTYDADPTPYVDPSMTGKANGDGTYTVVPLSAENAVASIGSNYYNSLSAAVAAAENGDTIKLLNNVALPGRLAIAKDLRIDMNGKTISVAGASTHGFSVVNGGSLELTGSGTMNVTGDDVWGFQVVGNTNGATWADTTAKTTLTIGPDVVVDVEKGLGVWIGGKGATLNVYGTINSKNDSAIFGNGTRNAATNNGGTEINIYDGASVTAKSVAIYQPQLGTVNITGGTVEGYAGIGIKSGTLNITGGTVRGVANDDVLDDSYSNTNGIAYDGSAIVIDSYIGYSGQMNLTISGDAVVQSLHSTAIHEIGNVAGMTNVVNLKVEGGYLSSAGGKDCILVRETTKDTVSVTGGAFTANPGAYAADGYAAAAETKVVNGVTYYYTVAQQAEEPDVETAVTAGEPSVEVGEILGLPEDFGTELAGALNSADTAKDLTDAAVGLSSDAGVVGTEDAADKALTDAGISTEDADITVVVEPYLKVEVTGYDETEKTLTLDIDAYYNVKATTNPDDMTDDNTVSLREGVAMNVTTPVDITIPLPTDFAGDSDSLYVKHVKDSGKTYYHLGTVSGDTLTFTNAKGFSTFTVLGDSTGVVQAQLDGVYYDSLQDAVNDAVDGQTVTVLADGLSAGVTGSSRTITVKNGTAGQITVTLNGTALTLGTGEARDFTYTAPSGSGVTTYAISVESAANGTVTASTKSASRGTTVTLTVTPDKGYVLDTLTVTDKDGKTVALTDKGNGKYTFTMPASKVTVKAAFKAEAQKGLPFTDVAESAWYYDAVSYVYGKGIMTGTNDGTTFSPAMNLTRGMMAQILYNLEQGKPAASAGFTDVASGAWYADAVNWAAANGIVSGYGSGKFGPEDPITREQMAVLLYNYARYKGDDVTATTDLAAFSDSEQVSDWAEYAMKWAVAEKLIQGSNNSLNPLGTATRAEVAQLFTNLLKQDA